MTIQSEKAAATPVVEIDDLECEIADIVNMSIVLQTVIDDMWRQKVEDPESGFYTKLMLTEAQVNSVDFVVCKLGSMAKDLSEKYFETLKDGSVGA